MAKHDIPEGVDPVLARKYAEHMGFFSATELRLRKLIGWAEALIEDRDLVRARLTNVRTKALESLARKAHLRRWNADKALRQCSDLVGARVTCNNVADVYRFVELLKGRLPDGYTIQDYIAHPKTSGYRAVHINFSLEHVPDEIGFMGLFIPCEIQIRTRLQDAWGELTHSDIYKDDIPSGLAARALDLAELLTAAERAAGRIREDAMTAVGGAGADLSVPSLASLGAAFAAVFGRHPPDYVARQALNACRRLGISDLRPLPPMLLDGDFRELLATTHQRILGYLPANEVEFLAAIYAVARDRGAARAYMRRVARRELREQEAFVASELLTNLPDSLEDMLMALEQPSEEFDDISGWATALGATAPCAVCHLQVVDPDGFAEAAIDHYQATDDTGALHRRIVGGILASSVEQGAGFGGTLCAYHREQEAKD